MTDRTKKNAEYILSLWKDSNLTVRQISQLGIPGNYSFRQVQKIIYLGNIGRPLNPNQTLIYEKFLLYMQMFRDQPRAIRLTFDDQPIIHLSETTIRHLLIKVL